VRDLQRAASTGLGVFSLAMTAHQRASPARWAVRLRERVAASGGRLCCLAGPAARLVAHDEADRRQAVATVAEGIEAVALAGAERLFVQPGGFSPRGPWWFHPLNFDPRSRRAYVRSIQELAGRAEARGVGLVLEGYQGSVVESPAVMRELIESVGSPVVGANLDYVNFLTPPLVARWPESLDAMAEQLGQTLVSVHVKDCVVEPRLACHVDERAAGSGDLDLRPVVELGRRTGVPLLVEHLDARTAAGALRHVRAVAG
jgi:sugar phosphate isomerase/epimerase